MDLSISRFNIGAEKSVSIFVHLDLVASCVVRIRSLSCLARNIGQEARIIKCVVILFIPLLFSIYYPIIAEADVLRLGTAHQVA